MAPKKPSEALEMHGYNVCSFTNPILAYENIKQNPNKYSLLIADYRMPDMDGLSLASKLSELNKKINVILMSAYDDIKCNYEFLRKPIPLSTLIKVVEKKMGNPLVKKMDNPLNILRI
ncbi:MAG TPA: response regulator [Nitrososphaeraceae archaeon]|nr:response regulator [Nitrososphaeraceae archaeon]